jgi:hypothetical protein
MSQIPDIAPAYVSVVNEFPEDLYLAMGDFISSHPQWDQYRLMQAALAGFLFQQGCNNRSVAQHYLNGLFRRETTTANSPSHSSSHSSSHSPSHSSSHSPSAQPIRRSGSRRLEN